MESSSSRLSSAPFTLLRLLSTGFSPDLRGIPVTDEITFPLVFARTLTWLVFLQIARSTSYS
jgi:hypothetical protein